MVCAATSAVNATSIHASSKHPLFPAPSGHSRALSAVIASSSRDRWESNCCEYMFVVEQNDAQLFDGLYQALQPRLGGKLQNMVDIRAGWYSSNTEPLRSNFNAFHVCTWHCVTSPPAETVRSVLLQNSLKPARKNKQKGHQGSCERDQHDDVVMQAAVSQAGSASACATAAASWCLPPQCLLSVSCPPAPQHEHTHCCQQVPPAPPPAPQSARRYAAHSPQGDSAH